MAAALSSSEWRPTVASAPVTELSQSASTARVSVKLLAPFIDAARPLNIRLAGGLASAGLTRADLDKPDLRVSHALIDRMLRAAISTSGDRALGLRAAERLQPSHLDVVEYATLDRPLIGADPGLASVLERHAAQSLQKLGHKPSLSERVRQLIARDLTNGKLTAEQLALRLGMSSRTLQRRLVADGFSYRTLIDEVR